MAVVDHDRVLPMAKVNETGQGPSEASPLMISTSGILSTERRSGSR